MYAWCSLSLAPYLHISKSFMERVSKGCGRCRPCIRLNNSGSALQARSPVPITSWLVQVHEYDACTAPFEAYMMIS